MKTPEGEANSYFEVSCDANGEYVAPVTWPKCRNRVKCRYAPEPPASSNMELKSFLPVNEYEDAIYECKSGFMWDPEEWEAPWPGMNYLQAR